MPNNDKYLGEFEQVMLLALMRLGSEAYGARIRQLLRDLISRDVAIGALYTTLERMEKKGLVTSTLGESTPERGGRAKRYFKPTAAGEQALRKSRDSMQTLWQGIQLNLSGS